MTFKNKLSKHYDDVQMEGCRERIEEFLERVVESAAQNGVDKKTVFVYKDDVLAEDVSLVSFESFLKQEEISYRKEGKLEGYILDLTE